MYIYFWSYGVTGPGSCYCERLDTPALRSEVQVTRYCFDMDPCFCWRSSLGTWIQGKTFRYHFALLNTALVDFVVFAGRHYLWLSVCFPAHKAPFEKRSALKEKNLLPSGANSFLSGWTSFRMRDESFWQSPPPPTPPLIIYPFP